MVLYLFLMTFTSVSSCILPCVLVDSGKTDGTIMDRVPFAYSFGQGYGKDFA